MFNILSLFLPWDTLVRTEKARRFCSTFLVVGVGMALSELGCFVDFLLRFLISVADVEDLWVG